MTFFARLRSWLRAIVRRSRLETAMDTEMRFHMDARADELARSGVPAAEAQRQARVEFGALDARKDECRQSLGLRFWDDLRADLIYALRNLRHNPGFSILAILCLTLGIGSNAAVFSWIEGTLLRPYPLVVDEDRVMVLAGTDRAATRYVPVSWPDFEDFRRNCTLIDSFIAEHITGATLAVGERAESAVGSIVSANYFDALGVHPILGRGFRPDEDDGRNAHPVVVISYTEWQERFHGDPAIIGKTQVLNNLPHTIVGVAPQGFYGTFVGYTWQFWVPASMQESFDSTGYKLDKRDARWIEGFTRLKPGVTRAQAQAEISAVAKRLEEEYPETNRGRGITLLPLWEAPFNGATVVRPVLGITMAVVFFVLLIACANVSNLLLVRALARRHEMTVRLALGAMRRRLIKQLLTEGLILSLLAAAGGMLLAYWCRNLLPALLPYRGGVPVYVPGKLDWRVLALSAGVGMMSTLIFGLVPALRASGIDLAGSLKASAGAAVGGRGRSRVRSSLVLLQVALSFILLVSAGLVMMSLRRIRTASPGFNPDHMLVTPINLFGAGYDTARARNFENQLLDRVQALSGVEAAAYGRIAPFSFRVYSSAVIATDEYHVSPTERPTAEYNEISPGYLAALGIPLLSGREFTRADDETAPPVAVVNEVMATRFWPGSDPMGKRLQAGDRWLRVVGVARLAKYGNMTEAPQPFFYVPLRQNVSPQVALQIRTSLDPAAMTTALTREVHALDPDMPIYRVTTMREQLDVQSGSQSVAGLLLAGFGGLALLLAAVGLYGVMAYAVSQSTNELGLRMALGASPANLLRLVLWHGLRVAVAGVVLGTTAALLLTRLLGYVLYQVSPRDPAAFAAAFAVLLTASVAACLVPALRATRTDPTQALRVT